VNRRERERAEAERKRIWKLSSAVRSRWSAEQHAAELERLAEEAEAMIWAGAVTTFPPMWAKGSSANSCFTE